MSSESSEILAISRRLLASSKLEVISCEIVQRLWQGYGYVCRLQARGESQENQSLIMKYVKPPPTSNIESEGHIRKVVSYEVEQYFYAKLAPLLPLNVSVAQCYKSTDNGGQVALILQDLRETFPVAGDKRAALNAAQIHAAIRWLAHFHGHWQGKTNELRQHRLRLPPLQEVRAFKDTTIDKGVWLNGGYTYLATRSDEYHRLCQDTTSQWSKALCTTVPRFKQSIAERVAQVLSPATGTTRPGLEGHETLIHGDVKSENLFTSQSGDSVAFFDFQYVGLGCGLSDLAKLLTCSVPVDMLYIGQCTSNESLDMGQGEKQLLEYYRNIVEEASSQPYPWDTFIMHWQTALIDWLRFQASWGFWGNTDWLEARGRYILQDQDWLDWLAHAEK